MGLFSNFDKGIWIKKQGTGQTGNCFVMIMRLSVDVFWHLFIQEQTENLQAVWSLNSNIILNEKKRQIKSLSCNAAYKGNPNIAINLVLTYKKNMDNTNWMTSEEAYPKRGISYMAKLYRNSSQYIGIHHMGSRNDLRWDASCSSLICWQAIIGFQCRPILT